MTGSRAFSITLAFVVALALGSPATAGAQAGAIVHVAVTNSAGESADAWVTLTPEDGGATFDCRTQNGTCDIQGVRPGRYVVTATGTEGGRPPLPRVVPVPAHVPSIELRVRLL